MIEAYEQTNPLKLLHTFQNIHKVLRCNYVGYWPFSEVYLIYMIFWEMAGLLPLHDTLLY